MEWEIASPDTFCGVCQKSFDDRDEYCTAIFSSPEGFSRKDYCLACWSGPPKNVFSFWRTRCRLKPAPPKRFVNDEVLLEFFERLSEADSPERRKLHFIMAVLLLRKRLLKERSRRRDENGLYWILEAPRLEKTFEVRDQGLAESEIADLLHDLGQVLNLRLAQTTPADVPGDETPSPPD